MSDFVAYVESKAGKPHCVVPPGGGVYSQEHGNRRTELICDDATLPAGTRVTVVLMNRPTSAEPGWYSQHGHVRLWLASPPDGKRMETEFVMGSHDGSIQAGRATPAKSTPSPPPARLSPRFSRSTGRRVPAAVVQRPPREGERPQAVQVRRREGVAPVSLAEHLNEVGHLPVAGDARRECGLWGVHVSECRDLDIDSTPTAHISFQIAGWGPRAAASHRLRAARDEEGAEHQADSG